MSIQELKDELRLINKKRDEIINNLYFALVKEYPIIYVIKAEKDFNYLGYYSNKGDAKRLCTYLTDCQVIRIESHKLNRDQLLELDILNNPL